MNSPVTKRKEQARPAEAVLKAVGKKKTVTMRMDESLHKVIRGYAGEQGIKTGDLLSLLVAYGMDALTGDTLRPFAKVTWPPLWEWLDNNKPFAETVKKLHRDRLKELQDKIEIKE